MAINDIVWVQKENIWEVGVSYTHFYFREGPDLQTVLNTGVAGVNAFNYWDPFGEGPLGYQRRITLRMRWLQGADAGRDETTATWTIARELAIGTERWPGGTCPVIFMKGQAVGMGPTIRRSLYPFNAGTISAFSYQKPGLPTLSTWLGRNTWYQHSLGADRGAFDFGRHVIWSRKYQTWAYPTQVVVMPYLSQQQRRRVLVDR